jgi:hypothetical protein
MKKQKKLDTKKYKTATIEKHNTLIQNLVNLSAKSQLFFFNFYVVFILAFLLSNNLIFAQVSTHLRVLVGSLNFFLITVFEFVVYSHKFSITSRPEPCSNCSNVFLI